MIETKGLRIGNWVYCNTLDKVIKVTHAEIECAEKMQGHFNTTFHPIPLTEEILLNKCNGYYDSFISDNDCIIIDCTDDISIGWCGFLFLYVDGVMIRVSNANSNYLHQLQNLFFELKGTELEINL